MIAILLKQTQSSSDALAVIKKSGLLDIDNLKGGEFSKQTLIRFLKEEAIHGIVEVNSTQNASLSTMSSGQQRKALLLHLLNKDLGYIVLDDVLSNLDAQNKKELSDLLNQHSDSTVFIQLAYRKDELLNWIGDKYILEDEGLKMIKPDTLQANYFNPELHNRLASIFNITEENKDSNNEALIKFVNVNVNYDEKQVLKNLNWQVNKGEFWQIIGPNGSGKSTILSMVYGDNPKAYGQEIYLFGIKKGSGESVWDIKQKIGYYSASTTMMYYRNDSVMHMLIGGFQDSIGLYNLPSTLQIRKATEWLEALELINLKDKPFRTLTSGVQSLVMVARAMIKQPLLLILDEPTVGLDEENAVKFVTLVNAIATMKNTAIVYVSHREEKSLNPEFRLVLE
jgi:molybdate transport system ATP-binding protein